MPSGLPLPRRRRPESAVAALFLAVGCVTANGSEKSGRPTTTYDLDGASVVIPSDAHGADAAGDSAGLSGISALCGAVSIDCGPDNTPDDVTACAGFDGGLQVGAGGATFGAGGASGLGGSTLDAGDGAAAVLADSGVLKAQLTLPTAVGVVDAGPLYSCQIASTDNGMPVRRCGRAGAGGVGAPCSGSSDCRAGFACVGTQGAGQCRPYCCETSTVCGTEPSVQDGGHSVVDYCGQRPLIEGSGKTTSLLVPVCVPADGCRLEEPYPCTSGNCTCPADTACTVVGNGATGCVTPGTGTLGDACPCAAGYFCANSTHTCEKICKTSGTDLACAPGQCQATAGFPDGFGLCVGAIPTIH